MTSRKPQLPVAVRLVAAACVALWLMAVSACDLEHSLEFNHHQSSDIDGSGHSHEAAARRDDADSSDGDGDQHEDHHSLDAAGHSHESHDHQEGSCCSTLKASLPAAQTFFFNKPVFHPLQSFSVTPEVDASWLASSEDRSDRQAKRRDRRGTPELCLGPAHRALAPPLLVVG